MSKVILGDGLDGMLALEPGSVDLVLTDLPSGETAAGFDKPVDLDKFFKASWHCLKQGGPVTVMASSLKFAAKLMAAGGNTYRYDWIWSKSIRTGFLNSKNRPLRAHEFVLVFCRTGQTTYNPQMLETGIPINKNSTNGRSHGANYGIQSSTAGIARAGATDRYPLSVLCDKCVGTRSKNRIHPQQKPDSLFENMLLTYTNPGETVVDPCAGSGVTGRAADKHGRKYYCWDISPRFGEEQ